MTDRELLDAAANAAGYAMHSNDDRAPGAYVVIDGEVRHWDPLVDDGDALRLAVALRISLDMLTHIVDATTGTVMCHEPWGDDHNAATRRAIVRAAAAMAA